MIWARPLRLAPLTRRESEIPTLRRTDCAFGWNGSEAAAAARPARGRLRGIVTDSPRIERETS